MLKPAALTLTLALSAAACGSSTGGGPNPPTPMAVSQTLTGNVTQPAAGGCGGDTHNLSMSPDTEVAVTLVETADPAQAVSIQVCYNGVDNGNCTIKQQRLNVGQTLRGTTSTRGTHNIKPLPIGCVTSGPPITTPQSYRLQVAYTTGIVSR